MAIRVQCPRCEKKLKARDELAGKRIKCPGCGQVVVAPAAAADPLAITEQALDLDATRDRVLPGLASTVGARPAATLGGDADGDLPAVPGYRVLREIARGGMGRVLAAHDLTLDREVALKILLPGANADRFVRESKITARLPHPGIPPVYALGTLADGSPFLAMKLVAGQTLAVEMKTADRPRLLQVFAQVCQVVGFAHRKGIIHRDLKPANVMVGGFGEVQVMDWGLAKELASRERERPEEPAPVAHAPGSEDTENQTQAGSVMGTPAYMAPEQARGEATDARADVFALGGILCAILTGAAPFGGRSPGEVIQRAAAGDLGEALKRLDGCGADAELIELCRRCLSPSPADRPANGRALADEMTAYLEGVEKRQHRAEREQAVAVVRTSEKRSRRKVLLALVASVLALMTLGGVSIWYYFQWQRQSQADAAALVQQQRQAQADAVELVVGPVVTLRDQALAQAGDVSRWQAALAAVEQAQAGGDAAAQDRLLALHTEIQAGLDAAQHKALAPTHTNSIGMEFVIVPKGKAWLGGGSGTVGDTELEIPADFYLGKYEVTQEEWQKVMGENPSTFSRTGEYKDAVKNVPDADLKRFPVETVTWPQCEHFLAMLNKLEKETGWVYRLPTETEWEYACRGGPMGDRLDSAFDFYLAEPKKTLLPDQANFNQGLKRPCKVGSYQPNRLGLFDMHGNVWEWCTCTDKAGAAAKRVARGGSWVEGSEWCRAEFRQWLPTSAPGNNYGLRLVCVPSASPDANAAKMKEPDRPAAKALQRFNGLILLDNNNLSFFDHSGKPLSRISGVGNPETIGSNHRIAVDTARNRVWASTGGRLQQHDLNDLTGQELLAVPGIGGAVAVDPATGNVWVAEGRGMIGRGTTKVYDPTGRLLNTYPFHGYDISYDAKGKAFWLADRQLVKLSLDGKAIFQKRLNCWCAVSIAVDSKTGKVWVATGVPNELLGFDNNGNMLHRIPLGNRMPFKVAVSAHDGSVWVTNFRRSLLHYTADGKLDAEHNIPARAAEVEESTGNVWVATWGEVLKVSAKGEILNRTKHNGNTTDAWIAVSDDTNVSERYLALLRGEDKPQDNAERLTIAPIASDRKKFAFAARLWGEALASDPKLGDDRQAQHRYHAARAALLAAAGQGQVEPPLDDAAKAKLRRQALAWLKAELMAWTKRFDAAPPEDRPNLVKALAAWQQDSALTGIRDAAALAKLPAEEQKAFTLLWADVAALLKKAESPKPKEDKK